MVQRTSADADRVEAIKNTTANREERGFCDTGAWTSCTEVVAVGRDQEAEKPEHEKGHVQVGAAAGRPVDMIRR